MKNEAEIRSIILRADETLRVAYAGLEMMKSPSPAKMNIGLRNVITFARCVTFVLQNISGKDPRFEAWYKPHQERMKNDEVFCFFRDARNNLEKQGRLETAASAKINYLGPDEMDELRRTKPPGATSFFIGGQRGGSGWIVELQNGEKVQFYIDIPSKIATVDVIFSGELYDKYLSETKQSAVELSSYVLNELSKIVDDAGSFFLGSSASQVVAGKRLPPFLRVIK